MLQTSSTARRQQRTKKIKKVDLEEGNCFFWLKKGFLKAVCQKELKNTSE
jgi:hypothetical protein